LLFIILPELSIRIKTPKLQELS